MEGVAETTRVSSSLWLKTGLHILSWGKPPGASRPNTRGLAQGGEERVLQQSEWREHTGTGARLESSEGSLSCGADVALEYRRLLTWPAKAQKLFHQDENDLQ